MRKKAFALGLLLVFSIQAFAQSSEPANDWEWRMEGRFLNRTAFTNSNGPSNNSTAWIYQIRTDANSNGWTVIADGVIYSQSPYYNVNGTLVALNLSTGRRIWSLAWPGNSVPASIAGGVAYFTTNNLLVAYNASTGQHVWNYTRTGQSQVYGNPAVYDGRVYFCSSGVTSYLIALNASTGQQVWNASFACSGGSAISDGVVFSNSLSSNNKTFAFNATTGAQIWNQTFLNYPSAYPSVADGMVYVAAFDNRTYALNASTGQKIWNNTQASACNVNPAVGYGRVYVSCATRLLALNASTGAHIWNRSLALSSMISVADGRVYTGTGGVARTLYALNASTGTTIWSYYTGSNVVGEPVISEGYLYVNADDGKLYAFGYPPIWNGEIAGRLNVSQTCGSEINATALNFGSLVPGQTSSQQSLLLTNIGSWNTSDITIEGTDWISTPTVNFTANYTKWSITEGFDYGDGASTQNTPASMSFNLENNETQATHFRVQIPLGQATAAYTQNITITTIC